MKKLVSRTLLAVMLVQVFFGAVAFAATGTSTGNTTIDGDGTTEYVDLEIYDMILPLSATLNFVLDPLGLAELTDTPVALSQISGGAIIAKNQVKVINNSAKDMVLEMRFAVTGNANMVATASTATVEADTLPNVGLFVVPSGDNIASTTSAYTSSGRAFMITGSEIDNDATNTKLGFVLGAADYTIAKVNGEVIVDTIDGSSNGTGIQLGGAVNSKANWSSFTGDNPADEISITAKFSYRAAKNDFTAASGATNESAFASSTTIPWLIASMTSAQSGDNSDAVGPGYEVDMAVVVEDDPEPTPTPTPVATVGFTDPDGGAPLEALTIQANTIDPTKALPVLFTFGGEEIESIVSGAGLTFKLSVDYWTRADGAAIMFGYDRLTAWKNGGAFVNINMSDGKTYRLTIQA